MRIYERLDRQQHRIDSRDFSMAGAIIPLLSDTTRQSTARYVLECLKAFFALQSRFFMNGFSSEKVVDSNNLHRGFLDLDPVYPAEYALNVILEQVTYDYEVLVRIIAHRTPTILPPDKVARVDLADKLAYQALQVAFTSATDKPLIEPATVLTYFQKSISIRVIPYAPVALIGLPHLGSIEKEFLPFAARELLSIPHEVGHHVYWRVLASVSDAGKRETTRDKLIFDLSQSNVVLPLWIYNWIEEIFADVYGCLIAGPISALTIQEMLGTLPAHLMSRDDGHYPAPLVRPFIHLATLRNLTKVTGNSQFANAAIVLQQRWVDWIETTRALSTWFIPFGETDPVTVVEAESHLATIVDFMIENALNSLLPYPGQKLEDRLWSIGPSDRNLTIAEAEKTIRDQFTCFVEAMKQQSLDELPELTIENGFVQLQCGDNKIDPAIPLGKTGADLPFETLREQVLKDGKKPDINKGGPPWWLDILKAGYWTTDGPGPKQVGS